MFTVHVVQCVNSRVRILVLGTARSNESKQLLAVCNLADIERKLDLYRHMFECNCDAELDAERDPNFIRLQALQIELIAGGLNWPQQQYILRRIQPNALGEISFIEYLAHVPLFLSMHEGICRNPLDMSDSKYVRPRTPPARPRL